MFNVAAILIDIELLDAGFAELGDYFVSEAAGEAQEAGVGHLGVVRDGEAGIGVNIFWSLAARNSVLLRRIQDLPVLVVPGRMQGSFFRLEVMTLRSAATSSLVGMALTV